MLPGALGARGQASSQQEAAIPEPRTPCLDQMMQENRPIQCMKHRKLIFSKKVSLHWTLGSNNQLLKVYKRLWIVSLIFPLGLIVSSVSRIIKKPQRKKKKYLPYN